MPQSSTTAHRSDGTPELWVCSRCGYVYSSAAGEPASDTPPDTCFEDLPDDWCCPDCGADKEYFFF